MMANRTSNFSDSSTLSTQESSQGTDLRPLLPAPRSHPAVTHAGHRTASLARRRVSTSLACESCRRRKSKCNGARPTCSQCRAKHIDCVYRQTSEGNFRERLEALEVSHPAAVVYRAIQTRPEAEVHEIVRRIRAGAEAEAIARQLSTADLLLQVHLDPKPDVAISFFNHP
ncbi:hypothetical protein FOXG_19641 [Fusarium oxysporum f. sp. lycopersici 4287]|uniref:Zn(2)-C6 fungal-type domain-containing protein n=1 Tax=Fusarium oxysporum f. sp. lycopersici (strain 4287 / CBS 123668 / FGSC 9935 / NRRL 34936) TaxID=426428 RepID=A0A0J9V526_FUSO4|nr:hypothetical protein FOXG_19641 [Fusarium oxysporum f. sp. lycopersici 4287]XP_018244391.1 hypothetical protein FOXG_19641 [Fusarium oxysporum f. sp. lycopersici 4287]KNB06345.1 hypothetical protein FOXG_19641 [Fusarium oxysporum f. sp. lycopersici 4287]KNB06346.1 hypothetical protein FOXG_19641 [Fusarium oxysporum f. sp. lycopersici 4287]